MGVFGSDSETTQEIEEEQITIGADEQSTVYNVEAERNVQIADPFSVNVAGSSTVRDLEMTYAPETTYNIEAVDFGVVEEAFNFANRVEDARQENYADVLGLTEENMKITAGLAESTIENVVDLSSEFGSMLLESNEDLMDYARETNKDVIELAKETNENSLEWNREVLEFAEETREDTQEFATGVIDKITAIASDTADLVKDAFAMATEKDISLKNNQVTFILGGVVLMGLLGVMAFSRKRA